MLPTAYGSSLWWIWGGLRWQLNESRIKAGSLDIYRRRMKRMPWGCYCAAWTPNQDQSCPCHSCSTSPKQLETNFTCSMLLPNSSRALLPPWLGTPLLTPTSYSPSCNGDLGQHNPKVLLILFLIFFLNLFPLFSSFLFFALTKSLFLLSPLSSHSKFKHIFYRSPFPRSVSTHLKTFLEDQPFLNPWPHPHPSSVQSQQTPHFPWFSEFSPALQLQSQHNHPHRTSSSSFYPN